MTEDILATPAITEAFADSIAAWSLHEALTLGLSLDTTIAALTLAAIDVGTRHHDLAGLALVRSTCDSVEKLAQIGSTGRPS